LPSSPNASADDRHKRLAALQRAVPVTRMVDYGVPLGDALQVHALAAADDAPEWDMACESLAERHASLATIAQATGHVSTAAQAWRAMAALLLCAQLAFNRDVPRKRLLYERAQEAMSRHAALRGDVDTCMLPTAQGDLNGWVIRPARWPAAAAVLVLGGLSGWGAAYLDMGRALAARGVLAILGEGPGQGLSRLRGGMHLGPRTLPHFGAFLDHAQSLSARRFGVWGNSFGGLLAAHLAAHDRRVRAACINGAPMAPAVPSFRTAREQMEAVFGTDDTAALAERLKMLGLQPGRDCIDASLLVVEGGRDPLVAPGEQAAFFALAPAGRGSTLRWDDGEHTIYNRAEERNARIADWFADHLGAGDA
jgi:alpha-beta hydrolase superfamily lysophospholipase